MGKASEIWKEVKPKIGEMLAAVNDIETRTEKAQEEAYQKGLSDAWECARKIGSNSMCSLKGMGFDFSQCVIPDYNPSWFVVKNYSASECIEKIRQYEQEKEERDGLRQNIQTIVDKCGYTLDEIAEVLAKMKEGE
jgi:hypothetical protein